jgi:putative addiction module killer protein
MIKIPLDTMYPICYIRNMNKIRFTKDYRLWYNALNDLNARVRIDLRLNSVRKGSFGDQRHVGNGIFELKIDYGPGYRVYYKKKENDIVVLLCGGDKSTQQADVDRAKEILMELENENV